MPDDGHLTSIQGESRAALTNVEAINESGQVANFVRDRADPLRPAWTVSSSSDVVGGRAILRPNPWQYPLYWSQSPSRSNRHPYSSAPNRKTPKPAASTLPSKSTDTARSPASTSPNKVARRARSPLPTAPPSRTFVRSPTLDQDGKTWDRSKLHYVEFDLHKGCSGMKFGNVAPSIIQRWRARWARCGTTTIGRRRRGRWMC